MDGMLVGRSVMFERSPTSTPALFFHQYVTFLLHHALSSPVIGNNGR